ncbi:unnamed protein product [Rotaria sp. Silwood2]|nr:unnamed protein product [Rotaria sp. Silwood2]CAF2664528.1 unnamed protein product [Rotaria sp. Silwood2]CAF2911686.1 unnamed protein product [Rotaria sp. Silwood2]CAF3080775.1 unnamed protein product [Rotaria sp. Silwood2]CAF4026537.1 unnamed protein product [Rotaria sp. Silwood2]
MWCLKGILILCYISMIIAQSLPLLLLVSFDGFRHDYPKLHGPLKNFHRLQERGVHAQKMIPTFATTTFPNHYTMITGLYEEVHGLISNQMFDPKTNVTFDSSNNITNVNWWPYPSIWSINEQRKGARSGVVGWPQMSVYTSKYQSFSRKHAFRDMIDKMILWFNDPIEPINFGAMYFFEPDLTGHRTGPYSKNMTKMVRECDEHLGYLLDKIDANEKLRENLHLIVTSDHGMEQINGTDNPVYIEDYIDRTKVKAYGAPPVMNIFVQSGKVYFNSIKEKFIFVFVSENDIDIVLKNLSKIPHSQSYKRKDIPERYHYKNHERIGDILLIFEAGYEILRRPSYGAKKYNSSLIHGNHGYDNQHDSMKSIFYASGPQLKRNFTLDNSSLLYNVDLFGLMCLILNIEKCPPSNGSLENIQSFFIDSNRINDLNRRTQNKTIIYSIVVIAFGLILIVAIIWLINSFRNRSATKKNLRSNATKNTRHSEYEYSPINNLTLTSEVEDQQV